MRYDFEPMRTLMNRASLTTVSLLHISAQDMFVSRNAFAVAGVIEDPATGAAAAALGGMLVDLGWPGLAQGDTFHIQQGEDMGQPSLLHVTVTGVPGASIRVSGATRTMAD
jgi:predicted PhzF superfamily epimerase YddE/YHI9